ncbi:MAG: DUF3089 domain-containing protein [Proteobacteria bacterium]|nr:DUF3089 domain-containing protein [Pseudomonadota bacterium]
MEHNTRFGLNTIISGTVIILLSLVAAGCSDSNNSSRDQVDITPEPEIIAPTNPFEGYTSPQYDDTDNWVCLPDIEGDNNVCNGDLSATLVFADGSTQLEEYLDVEDPALDCFYVYPTVSSDEAINSDLEPGIETIVTYIQAARYRSVCKMFAPMYRQVTAAGLALALSGGEIDVEAAFDLAYGDVLDAFKQFIANSQDRPFILIGHSQGTSHLIRLIQEEVETQDYLAQHMVAAHLIGLVVELPNDSDVGGSFQSTPACTFDNETGCFVNYSSFLETNPPTDETGFFGITREENTRVACTHPVDLGAGRLNLDAYFSAVQLRPYVDDALNASISTPFTKLPGLIQGECIEQGNKGYLSITIDADPSDPRIDELGNESRPGWGLHSIDIPLAQGDLVKLAQRQADKWLSEH